MSAHTLRPLSSRGIASIYVFALLAIVIIAVFSALYAFLGKFAVTYSNAASKIAVLTSSNPGFRLVDVVNTSDGGLDVMIEFSNVQPVIRGQTPCLIESLDGMEKIMASCDAYARGNLLIAHIPPDAAAIGGRYIEVLIPHTQGLYAFRLYHGPIQLDVSLPPSICYYEPYVIDIATTNNSTGWCKTRIYVEFYVGATQLTSFNTTLIIPPHATRYTPINLVVMGFLPTTLTICVREVVNENLEYPPICYYVYATTC